MYEGVRAPAVHSPRNIMELIQTRKRYPTAILWSGGTSIMGKEHPYPYKTSNDIIYLGKVQELLRINRTERYLEIGSQVSIEQLLTVGQHILPPLFARACETIGSSIIRGQATIGGSLCIKDYRLNIAGALSVLDTLVEIRGLQSGSRWIPMLRLYNSSGNLILNPGDIVTRIRIHFENAKYQYFKAVGRPFFEPESSVIFCVFSKPEKATLLEYRFSLTFPNSGIFKSRELESLVTSNDLPLTGKEILQTSAQLRIKLELWNDQLSPLQIERACRVFEHSLHRLNTKSFSQ